MTRQLLRYIIPCLAAEAAHEKSGEGSFGYWVYTALTSVQTDPSFSVTSCMMCPAAMSV